MTDVIGAIRDKWLALGGAPSFGEPLDIERPTFDGVGRAQSFGGGGTISWHPAIGQAFAVYGAIGQKWLSLGREAYGYPVTDEFGCADGVGRASKFLSVSLDAQAWIFWTPSIGAHEVHGLIALVYQRFDFEAGSLGYPVSDEQDIPGQPTDRRSRFQHGAIDFTGATGEANVVHSGNLQDDYEQNPIDD